MTKYRSLLVAGALVLGGLTCVPTAWALDCVDNPAPAPTPYPDATPPPEAEATIAGQIFGGVTFEVDSDGELLSAVASASAGDTIQLSGTIRQSVTVSTSGIRFMGAPGARRVWNGTLPPDTSDQPTSAGLPTLEVAAGVTVTLVNLEVIGGWGSFSGGMFGLFGTDGGDGGVGILARAGSVVHVIDSSVAGRAGSFGGFIEGWFCMEPFNYCGEDFRPTVWTGAGGDGGAAWAGQGSLYADLSSVLKGGQGTIGYPGQCAPDWGCCILTGATGQSTPPGAPTQWVEFTTPFGDEAARAVGDFDGSGCSDVADFLLLLDAWQTVAGGSMVNIADFLALIDNWQVGC